MMKLGTHLAIALLFTACGGAPARTPLTPETPPDTAPDTGPDTGPDPAPDAPSTFKPGPDGFPLPLDADDGAAVPEGGGRITVFKVPRGKVAVADELKAMLATAGWTIDAEEVSPRGAIRLDVSKDGRVFKARLTGDDSQAALIITAP